jgi:hypothetical protein
MNATRWAAYERKERLKAQPGTLVAYTCCAHGCADRREDDPDRHTRVRWRARTEDPPKRATCPLCGAEYGLYAEIIYETKCLVCAKHTESTSYPGADYCGDQCRKSRSWKPTPLALPPLPPNNYLSLLPPDLRIELARYCQDRRTHRDASHLLAGNSELGWHFPASDEQFFDPEMFT